MKGKWTRPRGAHMGHKIWMTYNNLMKKTNKKPCTQMQEAFTNVYIFVNTPLQVHTVKTRIIAPP